ncbi:hypothetical protein M2132_001179 [Dysgonomonas sp. PH5-45]|uniref:hypothetical protein n=1 Tax=unclassified Dysgonomonas TaxID=2630389 RepID=UPI002475C971|nr:MULTISPECIES: hypothetical protein [unclassified Dysgonomonas]MDH6354846.1 hypothetical protein [Dysgonomonas sp. PH5-45]MDH6387745.1 hypothetical protein [Dysgonomonas sp. PH5-37]
MKLKPVDNKLSLKRYFYLKAMYRYVNRLVNTPFDRCFHFGCNNNTLPPANNQVDIVTVAFNNEHVIKLQIKYIRENITDQKYTFLVADNSNNSEKQSLIQRLCKEEGIGYIQLPRFEKEWLKRRGSYSHATAINWIYYNYISKRKPAYFALLDHDVFPTCPLSIEALTKAQGFYGYRRGEADGPWFLWPGLLFFRYSFISDYKVNFMPCVYDNVYLDTGGSLWKGVYSTLDRGKIQFASFKLVPLAGMGFDNNSTIEFIDGKRWLHSSNASHWRGDDASDHLIDEIIEKMNKE